MYTKFKQSKSLSISKKLFGPNHKQLPKDNAKKSQNNNARQVLDEYGSQEIQGRQKQNKKLPKFKQNIYYTSTCVQTDEECNMDSMKSIRKIKQFINNIPNSKNVLPLSSESSISSISLKKNHFRDQQNEKVQKMSKINPQKRTFLIEKNKSPKTKRQQNLKQLSTKTSIKEIEQLCSSQQINLKKSQISKNTLKKPIKDSTLEIAMKHMFRQLKQTRQQNYLLKEDLIRIKSQQYFYLNREKVKEMVVELQKEKEHRKHLEKENVEVKVENTKLKQQNQGYKKENYRMKRINAKMKDQLTEVHHDNIILRQRVNQQHKGSNSDNSLEN